jgi:hypothetical protein
MLADSVHPSGKIGFFPPGGGETPGARLLKRAWWAPEVQIAGVDQRSALLFPMVDVAQFI